MRVPCFDLSATAIVVYRLLFHEFAEADFVSIQAHLPILPVFSSFRIRFGQCPETPTLGLAVGFFGGESDAGRNPDKNADNCDDDPGIDGLFSISRENSAFMES